MKMKMEKEEKTYNILLEGNLGHEHKTRPGDSVQKDQTRTRSCRKVT